MLKGLPGFLFLPMSSVVHCPVSLKRIHSPTINCFHDLLDAMREMLFWKLLIFIPGVFKKCFGSPIVRKAEVKQGVEPAVGAGVFFSGEMCKHEQSSFCSRRVPRTLGIL